MVYLSAPPQSSEGQAIQFIGQTNDASAISDGKIRDASSVIIVVTAAVVVKGRVAGLFDQTLHIGLVARAGRQRIPRESTSVGYTVKTDVSISANCEVPPFIARSSPRTVIQIGCHDHRGF